MKPAWSQRDRPHSQARVQPDVLLGTQSQGRSHPEEQGGVESLVSSLSCSESPLSFLPLKRLLLSLGLLMSLVSIGLSPQGFRMNITCNFAEHVII